MSQCPSCTHTVGELDRFCPACGAALLAPSRMPTLASPSGEPSTPTTPSASSRDGAGARMPGTILAGRYRIIERVGHGGMGEVFRAEDLRVGQTVALKFIRVGQFHGELGMEMFLSEVRLARQIGHPNVCRVYDIGEADGAPFLSMEFVDGEDLASLLRRIRRLPADKATEIAREICAGLAAIHDRQVLHRDLKPANVMIDGRGRVRITDFGLAALQNEPGQERRRVGTPAYMAPEVREGSEATYRSDLFSLGLVLYETYTGGPPEEAPLVARGRVPAAGHKSASAPQRDLEPEVRRILARCLDPDPARRPSSALEVAAALPGGDPIAAALATGRTLEPELLAAANKSERAMNPVVAWACLAALVLGLSAAITVAPHTRLVSAAHMQDPPPTMAARASLLLRELGFPEPSDAASGLRYDESLVERTALLDRRANRWEALAASGPPLFLFWHRQSPAIMTARGALPAITPTDPPATVPGMAQVQFDMQGRLRLLEAIPVAGSGGALAPGWPALFKAAALDSSAFSAVEPRRLPPGFADLRLAWEGPAGAPAAERLRVEAASFGRRPVLFAVSPALAPPAPRGATESDLVSRLSAAVRAVVFLVAFLVAAWLARRNLRAGRGDRRGAFRVGSVLMASRLFMWLLGGHHTVQGFTSQFAMALAWSLYDFAFARVFYLAIEPYVRQFWPRVLVSWVRLLGGRHDDPLVGRDLLVGCLLGVGLCLGVAAHQAAPVLVGLPPGRPDNVGFVEAALQCTLGLKLQLAQLLLLDRSAVVNALGFVVVLVVARLLVRRSWPAYLLSLAVFVPVALPHGELPALNVAFALVSGLAFMSVLMRVGLLAAVVGLIVHSTLQATALTWRLNAWPGDTTWFPLAFVLALAGYGFVRAMGGRMPVPQGVE